MSPQSLRLALDDGTSPRDIVMALAYESGMTLQEIGDRHKLTRERVRQCIKPLIFCRPRGAPRPAPAEKHRLQLEEMWARGLTLKQIALAMDSTANRVETLVSTGRRAGWTLPYRYAKTRREAAKAAAPPVPAEERREAVGA
jgi:DNA-binding CsgD family transcriptional regulator